MTALSIARGSRGPDVRRWELFLQGKGLFVGSAEGIFDAALDAATRQFQEQQRLKVDGVVGTKTYGAAQALGFVVFRRMRDDEVSTFAREQAKAIRDAHWKEPLGTEFPFQEGQRSFIARLEQHYHEPRGPMRPWGYHTGVSLFVATMVGPQNEVVDP